ncbi:CHAD domain-containing protein [Luteithermobacter gelatinilyticus]|uniref:CHAD domain-containing protein n=1 Tax=Luteithermobacter gelatinilyticus TaxID=2582913 RepID=UPI0011070D9A|nr:CHAD domain-containing protein [Luteithermobacter gelatinilyticus]
MYFYGPETLSPEHFSSDLCRKTGLVQVHEGDCYQQFLDTFDGRLFNAGGYLLFEEDKAGRQMIWRSLKDDRLLGRVVLSDRKQDLVRTVSAKPAFVWDLPSSPVRRRLEKVLDMRRLLPLLDLKTTRREYHLLGRDRKKIATVFLEYSRVNPAGQDITIEDGWIMRLLPVRGYEQDAAKLAQRLQQDMGFETRDIPYLSHLLRRCEITPGGYSSKLSLALDPQAPAGTATKQILNTLFDTLRANEEGLIADLDSEFLHDFRVAVRRTRSAFSQIKNVFPGPEAAFWKEQFSWLGQITGPKRDLDVYVLKFDAYLALLPPEYRETLAELRKFLLIRQCEEQKKLVRALRSKKYRDLIRRYKTFLRREARGDEAASDALRPIKQVADKRIWKMFVRIIAEGRAITADSPAEDLHELRKTGKKLRYLLEFFQSLYPAGAIRGLIKTLKNLQDNLGDFQDYEVQAHSISGFSQAMQARGMGTAQTFMAMGILCSHLLKGQQAAREEFAARFTAFDTKDIYNRFQTLFGSGLTRQ